MMNDLKKIDLHMHTRVSDGTDTPEELVRVVKNAGIGLFSITDHDAVKGAKIITGILKKNDPLFITGIELSCRDEEGKYHILGYGLDPDAVSVKKIVKLGYTYRMDKVLTRLEYLKEKFNIVFPEEEIMGLLAADNPGKPHIGNLMVKYHYAETKEQAIRDYIDQLHIRSSFLTPKEVIESIRQGGGIPVLAHPSFGSGSQRITGEDMDRRLCRLMDLGLQGVEAFYSGFSDALCSEMLSFADRYGLYVTAGSDYHGRNKPVRPGQTGLDRAAKIPAGLTRFLEDVRYAGCRDS